MQQLAQALPGQTSMAIMALVGSGIAIYLTSVHYAKVPLICSTSGIVDCASVLTSPYSVVPGTTIPVTLPGLMWFLVSGGLAVTALAARWRGIMPPARLFTLERLWGGLGLVTILYLIYAEIVQLHHLCAWCTVVHALVLATFLVALVLPAAPSPPPLARQPRPANKVSANHAGASPSGKNAGAARPKPTSRKPIAKGR
jgi:uncharacterized membrane protein